MKKTVLFSILALLALTMAACSKDEEPATGLSADVVKVISAKTALVTELAKKPALIDTVKAESQKNGALTLSKVAELDRGWQDAGGEGTLVTQLMGNGGALALRDFQRAHPEFKEIFATDRHGLNAAQTNKTSDYLQSDEGWWGEAFNGGAGHTYHGKAEFDQSARTEAISIYVPVMDNGKAIGVIKAVVDLAAVKKEA